MSFEYEFISKITRNDEFLEEVFSFDPRTLQQTDSSTISKYTIALSQYIIYLNSKINKKKVSLMQKKRSIDIAVSRSDIKAKTKWETKRKVIDADEALSIIERGVNAIEEELTLLDGTIPYFVELINSFKKELSRREQELKFSRYERK